MDVIVESQRDRRTLEWLIAQAGEAAVQTACSELAGARKCYVSNIAKALGLSPPESLSYAAREVAVEHLADIRRMLGKREP